MRLLEREDELARLAAALAGAREGRGSVVVVEGAAGLGKTALLREARAAASGMTVLSASGSELEHEFAFGVVRQLLGRVDDLLSGGDRFAVLHALYWLVAERDGPVLVCVDDAQWADDLSLRFLAFLARRVADLGVVLLLAARPPLPAEDRTILDTIAASASTLAVAPLTADAIATLAGPGADPAFIAEIHHVTAGNALLVEEALADGAVVSIGRRVGLRLAALGEAAEPLAAAVAVLGDGAELAVAAPLAGVGEDAARAAAAELVAADLFEDDPLLRFRHPLIRAAVADRLPAVERGEAHARAAHLLAARGRPPGVLAAHLLAAPPAHDAWATETLRAAALEATAQGAPELAATYLRHALVEPHDVPLLLELGRAEHAAGSVEGPDRLREAWKATGSAEVALELATMLADQTRWAEAVAVVREVETDDRELGLRLLALAADCARMDPRIGGAEPERLTALAKTLGGDTPAERWAIAAAALITPVDTAAEHARVAGLLQRTVADGARVTETGVVSNLIRAARLDEAERIASEVLDRARAGGLIQQHASMLSMRAWAAAERGELGAARDDLEAALQLGPEVALPEPVIASAAGLLAVVVAEQGEFERADELLERHDLADTLPEHQVMNLLLYWRSRTRLLQGRQDDAFADAQEVGRRYARLNIRRAVPPWRSLAAILSDDEALAAEELELAHRWGTPLAIATAHRGVGLITGDLDALETAVGLLEPSPHRLELARARIDLGAARRRRGERAKAREPLRQGMDAAHALGAHPLADRARTELLATGARPRRLALQGADALTPSERRVAQLAATGLTNRQIAQELFVTAATVDTHLRHVFQKLDVKARGDVSRALS
ncbi:AAA family ATPase [Solirubrobacter soli]|uniref:AAA family ATPase n=1 Tax=Solirubrobacter soli TaxID=363832 RepID=UPI0004011840|nr:LuxR family transcriptional regulator [Solirubrobacter soli]